MKCKDWIINEKESWAEMVCELEKGHEGPHSFGQYEWADGFFWEKKPAEKPY